MNAAVTFTEAWSDPSIFGGMFKDPATWKPWLVFAKVLFGLALAPDELALFQECTGRDTAPDKRQSEAWLIVGRRGGKSRFLALVAAFLAAFCDWSAFLAPGERAVIVIIAADRKQARAIWGYLVAFLSIDLLDGLIVRETADEIELSTGITIEIATCSYRTVRSRTILAALADECAFWASEDGSNPASEVIAALRPAMATVDGSMMLVASSPYSKSGPLYDTYKRYFGKADGPLVWKAPTWTMNPRLQRDGWVIREAYDRDELAANAEYGGEFRNDVDGYVTRETVEAVVEPGRVSLPPISGTRYTAFADPSGGSADSFTLAIAHSTGKRRILDLVLERKPPFSPEGVVQEFAQTLNQYGVSSVMGDRYAGEWPREQFRKYGITYEPSARSKSDIYRELLPMLNSCAVELLDNPRLIAQLASLERRTSRGGKDSIDHPPSGHDDVANAAAGVLVGFGASTYTLAHIDGLGAMLGCGGGFSDHLRRYGGHA